MYLKYNTLVSSLFAMLAVWTIFAAIPFFRLNGPYPQVDTQIMFLNFLCGLMFFYFSFKVLLGKYKVELLYHPLISISFLIAVISLVSSLFSGDLNNSFSGSPQIGQGVFWYLDLTIMSIIFSQITHLKKIRIIIFINLFLVTALVSFFTFFPNWKGIPISFYYFTDYLCFYGVLTFILLTTITKNFYIHLLGFLILGLYFAFIDNRAAVLFWITTILAGMFYYSFKLFKKSNLKAKMLSFLFSDAVFVFIIIFISFLILSSSIYFWSDNYTMPMNIKGTLLDAPVVRGKIFETSLYSLSNFKDLFIGNGWGVVRDLLIENMSPWQYDELRQGYNLHFHTHNEIAEHLVSVGLIGCLLFIIYMYFIFKFAGKLNFSSKLAWLLFFKINCFWFMWIGTFAVFAIVASCFILYKDNSFDIRENHFKFLINFLHKKSVISVLALCSGCFVLYGSYLTYHSVKIHSLLNYTAMMEYLDSKDYNSDQECLSFYEDLQRGGMMLDRFLAGYSSHIMSLDKNGLDEKDLKLLEELKCKADYLIKAKNFTSSLLATAMQADADYYFKISNVSDYSLANDDYKSWYFKANVLAEVMPKRGDLLLPFLSYAINNNKSTDALNICGKNIKGLESFCYLIRANYILTTKSLDETRLKKSIDLIKKSIKHGLFDELVYGFWFKQCGIEGKLVFCNYGNKGIPLSPNIIFLIGNKEKLELERLVAQE